MRHTTSSPRRRRSGARTARPTALSALPTALPTTGVTGVVTGVVTAVVTAVMTGLLTLPSAAAVVGAAPATTAAPYVKTTLHFKVTVPGRVCDVVGDVYRPTAASSRHRVPAVLTTNGFGGSKDDQAGMGDMLARRGYLVLSYSGLGFGGSGCRITLDDPAYDGVAARQLVSYLGGRTGIAFADAQHSRPAPRLDVVVRDVRDHAGVRRGDDPRVGMVGVSYGGGAQFAAAAADSRVDALVPMITWNDLSYSLGPNGTDQLRGVSTTLPGAVKLLWGAGFSASGAANGVQNLGGDPARVAGCPNFADFVCPALVRGATVGYLGSGDVSSLRRASVASYVRSIRVPVLLVQGEADTLFNLNEAIATYQALKAQRTPVHMVWQSWGHSDSTPAPGEYSATRPDPSRQYVTKRIVSWFDRFLKGQRVPVGPDFAYFRDWVRYTGIATPAYAEAGSYPVGARRTWRLSGDGTLRPAQASFTAGSRPLLAPAGGVPTALDPTDVVPSFFSGELATLQGQELPGTWTRFTSAALRAPLTVVGEPRARLSVSAPTVAPLQGADPATHLVLVVKLLDVGPDGRGRLIRGTMMPVRVPDVTRPFTVVLPAIAHRFAAGHRLALQVSGGSPNYRGNQVAAPVAVQAGAGRTLSLPVVP